MIRLPSQIHYDGRAVQLREIIDHPAYGAGDDGGIYSFYRHPGEIDFSIYPLRLSLWKTDSSQFFCSLERSENNYKAAHLICMAWHDPPSEEQTSTVCINKDYDDIRPSNLRWGTISERTKDNWKPLSGEENGASKLTADQCREIMSLRGHLKRREIAELFGISIGPIKRIWNGGNWRHLCLNKMKITRSCLRCGLCFDIGIEKNNFNKIYCSEKCRYEHNYKRKYNRTFESAPCVFCGRDFPMKDSQMKRRSKGVSVTCSVLCRNRLNTGTVRAAK
jgi:hypothetical protein